VIVRNRTSGLALGGYVLLAILFFGVRLLGHDGRTLVGTGSDPQVFVWLFAWWPHAILHGENPFVTHVIWAPAGENLAWTTSMPALTLAFAPLTLVAGPVASFDVAAVLMPALAAWTAFLLCRHITRTIWPSLAGGYIFGFSGYVLGQLQGHLNLTAIFLLPLVALVLLRFVEGEVTGRGLSLRLGALVALQLGLSIEIAFTATLVLLTVLVLAYVLVPGARSRLRSLPLPLLGSATVAAVLASPLLYFALSDFRGSAINGVSPTEYTADLLNFVVPTGVVASGAGWAHGIARHFTGNSLEQGAYLGLPTVLILVWFGVRQWRTHAGRFLLAALAAVVLLSFGSWLHVDGNQVVTLPWEHIGYLPLFENVLPVRFCAYVSLAAAVVVAMWASSRAVPRLARVVLPVLAVLALVPNLHAGTWRTTIKEPRFITSELYRACLRPSDNTLVLPIAQHGYSMLWQAEAGFRFRMAAGYIVASTPRSFRHPAGVAAIANGAIPDSPAPLLEYVRLKHVTVILLDAQREGAWRSLLDRVATPTAVGGVLLYRLDGSAGCSGATA
jgi:hypothetical protein